MKPTDRFARFAQTESLRRNLKRSSVRGALFMASGSGLDMLVRLVAIAILARALSPIDFGLLAMVTAITAVLDGFRDLGLSTATVQRAEITQQQVTNLFWINAFVGCVFATTLSAAAPLIATFYQDERLIEISIALSSVFVWNGLTVQHEALMTRQMRQGELAVIRLSASVLSVILAIALAFAGWGYWALVFREIARSAIVAFGVWARCLWLPGLPRRGAGTRTLVRFGGEISLTYLLTSLISNVDRLLIGRFLGAGPVGLYRQAQQLVLLPIEQLNFPIMSIAQPALSALQLDPDRYRRYYEKIVFLVSIGTVPLGLFVAVCAPEITLLMLGPSWVDATVFVRIFGVAAAIRPAIATSAVVLITSGFSTRFLALAILHGTVLTGALFLGLEWGAPGVALASVAVTVLLAYPKLYYSFVGTAATLRGFLRAIRLPVTSGIVMTASLLVLREAIPDLGTLARLLLDAIVGATTYLCVVWLHPKGKKEIKSVLLDLRDAVGGGQKAPQNAL